MEDLKEHFGTVLAVMGGLWGVIVLLVGIVLSDFKGKLKSMSDSIKDKRELSDCILIREGCMEKNTLRLEGLYTKIGDQIEIMDRKIDILKEGLDQKMDLIINRQVQVIKRIDDHIDKPK